MKKTTTSSIVLLSLVFLVTTTPTAKGALPWAPTTMTGYDLLYETSMSVSYGGVTVTGWGQGWVAPTGCNATGTCTAGFMLQYMEFSEAFPEASLTALKNAMSAYTAFEDVTADVPGAAFAAVATIGGIVVIGYAILSTMKHFIIGGAYNLGVFSADDGEAEISPSSATADAAAMKEGFVAVGTHASAVLGLGIPGYDLLLILGLVGAVSAIMVIRKRKQ